MKERPILFNASMVNSIISGLKKQTRRPLEPKWWLTSATALKFVDKSLDGKAKAIEIVTDHTTDKTGKYQFPRFVNSPYGKPGDRLWVRETFVEVGPPTDKGYSLIYRADDGDDAKVITSVRGWTPSIHMPRWASRITLEITDVRVERLKNISETDALAEGVFRPGPSDGKYGQYRCVLTASSGFESEVVYTHSGMAVDDYCRLWDSIYGKKQGESWQDNPWVWVYEFKVIQQG